MTALPHTYLMRNIAAWTGGIDRRQVLCPSSILLGGYHSILLHPQSSAEWWLRPDSRLWLLWHHSMLYLHSHSMWRLHCGWKRLHSILLRYRPNSIMIKLLCLHSSLSRDLIDGMCLARRHSMLHSMGIGLHHGGYANLEPSDNSLLQLKKP